MYRLQYLLLGRFHGGGHPLHAETRPWARNGVKGWHPEKMNEKRSDASVLVVGAGPAGLEATRALGMRGYRVTLADAGKELGGRLPREAALPGMSEYIRVRDYRAQQFHKLTNVEVFLESPLSAKDVYRIWCRSRSPGYWCYMAAGPLRW